LLAAYGFTKVKTETCREDNLMPMNGNKEEIRAMAQAYDDEAKATGWYGPEVTFGMLYEFLHEGQSILDIGIGTGLSSLLYRKAGLAVHGMDVSRDMLDACRLKGFADLKLHDLTKTPYPYEAARMDHAVCLGVLNFFSDLTPVFQETARILRGGGVFAFAVGHRSEDEDFDILVGPEHTKSCRSVTMYRHSARQIDGWVKKFGFEPLKDLEFPVFMDRERTRNLQAKVYLVKKPEHVS
jgi:predicted TPR repeat methyltransferase